MACEYRVIAAPRRAVRFKDLGKGEDAFHRTLAETLTALGLEGWDYIGVERLPQRRRTWLFWTREEIAQVMVFRREIKPILRAAEPEVHAPRTSDTLAVTPVEVVRARRVTRTLAPHEIRRVPVDRPADYPAHAAE
jgi:hypothetical protein